MIEYQPMTIEERKACALLAAEAFYDYDYFSIFVPDEKRFDRDGKSVGNWSYVMKIS